MKHLLMLLIVVSTYSVVTAQPWLVNLPQAKSHSELTLKDYQKAFNDYWEPFNLERGHYVDENGQSRKASGWKQFKRWEWFMENQVDAETGAFPEVTINEVMHKWKQNHDGEKNKNANWEVVGPSSSEGGYAGVGRINTIAFHPTDNDTYWIGAPAGGLWVTNDNGGSWTCLTDDNSVLGISDIFIPTDYATSNTIYIATGDRDASDNYSVGVLKSTDAGITWQATGLGFSVGQGEMVTRLLADPNDNQTIIAATSDGVYKTTDGGDAWGSQLTSTSFIDMEFKPGDFNTLYGSTKTGSIYVSVDGGDSWNVALSTGVGRIELAVSMDNAEVVYAIVAANDNGLYGIYKSENSGSAFSLVFDETNLMGWYLGGSDDQGGQGWYDLSIAVSPSDANLLLAGGVNTWRTTDGGANWDLVNHWYGGYGAQAVHADKHMLKYRNNGDLFECNDGGVYISDNDGASGSWTDKTNGMEISQIYKLGVAATQDDEAILGLQDNGTKLTSNNGSWDDVIGGDGMECLIDYSDEDIQYGSLYYGQMYRTMNSWSWDSEITPSGAGNGAWVTPYIIDPVNPQILYAGFANVWKSTNRGDSWTQISTMGSSSKLRSLAIAPSDSQTLYAADPYSIWKTTDGGDSWSDISSGLPSNTITYITVKNDDPNTLWVTLGGYDTQGVYESINGGDTWTNISAGLPELPVITIVQNKLMIGAAHLYAGTAAGVFIKIGDAQWESYSTNLPNVYMGELEIYYDDTDIYNSRLYAATYGRGLWKSPLYLEMSNPPVINTVDASSVEGFSAILNASVVSDFGSDITESGFIFGYDETLSYDDSDVQLFTNNPVVTSGSFSYDIDGLVEETTYYYRAYAINEFGIGYGVVKSFTTLGPQTYEVVFYVADAGHGEGVYQAEINVEGEVILTNIVGRAHLYLPNGNYTYNISADGYNEMPDETFEVLDDVVTIYRVITQVGLMELENADLQLYPNPATSELNIKVKGVFHAELFDVTGKSVMQKRIYRNGKMETNRLSPGVYFLHLENKTHKAIRKVLIQ